MHVFDKHILPVS